MAIVGAGLAGLGAGRTLAAAGSHVTIYEKSKSLGGRCATRRINGFTFDSGATFLAGKGSELERVVTRDLNQDGLVNIDLPVYVHSSGRIAAGNSALGQRRYVYRQGIVHLAELLAEDLSIHLGCKVEGIKRAGSGYQIEGRGMSDAVFDAVIITLPLPSVIELAATYRPRPVPSRARHRSCISVCLGYPLPFAPSYFATVDPDQRMPLTWLSVESRKSPDRAPANCTALVAQMSSSYSQYSMGHSDERTISETLIDVVRLLGKDFAQPTVTYVKRWRFSQPEVTVSFESINPSGATLLVAGDGLSQGRLESAYDSGITAAKSLLENK